MKTTKDYIQGYIIGLMIGEGTFTGDKKNPYIGARLHGYDPSPLEILQDFFGGKLYGPYHHDNRHYYFWKLHKRDDLIHAVAFFDKWLPPCRTREKFEMWREKYGL